jgi:hypothetical protein
MRLIIWPGLALASACSTCSIGRRRLDRFFAEGRVSEVVGAPLAWMLVEPGFDLLAEFIAQPRKRCQH